MIIAGHAKAIAERLVMIGGAVAIGIPRREFRALHDHHRVIVLSHDTQRFVQAIGKERPLFGFWGIYVHLAAMETGGQLTVGQEGESSICGSSPLGAVMFSTL